MSRMWACWAHLKINIKFIRSFHPISINVSSWISFFLQRNEDQMQLKWLRAFEEFSICIVNKRLKSGEYSVTAYVPCGSFPVFEKKRRTFHCLLRFFFFLFFKLVDLFFLVFLCISECECLMKIIIVNKWKTAREKDMKKWT